MTVTVKRCFSHKSYVADNHRKWLQCLLRVFSSVNNACVHSTNYSCLLSCKKELLKSCSYIQASSSRTVSCGWGSAAGAACSWHTTHCRMVGFVTVPLHHPQSRGQAVAKLPHFFQKLWMNRQGWTRCFINTTLIILMTVGPSGNLVGGTERHRCGISPATD